MAAYAALNSVMFILQQIRQHPRPPITIEKKQMDSLCENISSLQDFLEKHSYGYIGGDEGKESLESRIADAAYAAEDIIESRIVDQILARDKSCDYDLFCQDLQKVIEDMNFVRKASIEIQEKVRATDDDQLPGNIISMSENIIGPTLPHPTRKNTNTMVGFDNVLIDIMDRLTGHQPNRQVLPIVGMGGIGKTTLAINVYDHQYIMNKFDIRIWVTISQEYRLRDILIKALSCVSKTYKKDENKSSEDELGDQLYKSLCGRRYLIVLDDMWSVEVWEKLMLFFPDNNNGSRIMITTRLSNVSNHFGSCGFKMNFLDEDKSWDLFCKIVFPRDQCCPPELEEIGKKIAKHCKGLPLSIAVIGGLLANAEKTQHHWEYVAGDLNPIVNLEDDMHCLNILYLSYNQLPIHLKPCFLYMGVFSEDSIISVPLLKKQWVAEGFLKPIGAKCSEVVAEEYLKDLIERNLILVVGWGCSGKVKYCKIHDLLRHLCLREGEKDKFLYVRTVHDLENLQGIQSQRRISIHGSTSKEEYLDGVLEALPSASLSRSLTCHYKGVSLLSQPCRLVRVFNMVSKFSVFDKRKSRYSLEDIFKLVNSRYLSFETNLKLTSIFPSSIHLLWNLQTLIIKRAFSGVIELPPEIWEMSELRYLEIGCFFLPNPRNVPLCHDFILRNFHTLKRATNFILSEEMIKRIPNIRKFQISYYGEYQEGCWHNYCLNNLGLLNKLESLDMDWLCNRELSFQVELVQNFAFPHSLKKLTLYQTRFLWEDMRMIGSLPHLQILKLKFHSFRGPEWNPIKGEFLCLKFLQIDSCDDLVHWNANRTHFPCLEQLVLRYLHSLKEIPLDMGEILTLRSIELWSCSDSMVISAKNLLDERVEFGNDDLQVRVNGMPQFSSLNL